MSGCSGPATLGVVGPKSVRCVRPGELERMSHIWRGRAMRKRSYCRSPRFTTMPAPMTWAMGAMARGSMVSSWNRWSRASSSEADWAEPYWKSSREA